jgi:transcriptional antiterminator RfaH
MPAYWAVARVQPQREAFAVGHLEAAGFETFLPKVETKRTVGPLFRGYAFVLVVEQWRAIETTFGVLALVRFGDAAARCPDRKIEALRSRMNATGVIRLPPPPSKAPRLIIRKGARVRVTSGPFSGLAGIYAGMTTRQCELVLLNFLGATRPVKIASASIALQ